MSSLLRPVAKAKTIRRCDHLLPPFNLCMGILFAKPSSEAEMSSAKQLVDATLNGNRVVVFCECQGLITLLRSFLQAGGGMACWSGRRWLGCTVGASGPLGREWGP